MDLTVLPWRGVLCTRSTASVHAHLWFGCGRLNPLHYRTSGLFQVGLDALPRRLHPPCPKKGGGRLRAPGR